MVSSPAPPFIIMGGSGGATPQHETAVKILGVRVARLIITLSQIPMSGGECRTDLRDEERAGTAQSMTMTRALQSTTHLWVGGPGAAKPLAREIHPEDFYRADL